jgi:uncharacterized phiE125 gp8 family phage protein
VGLTLVTGPTVEPVSLAEAKAHLRVTTADDDAQITLLIIAARRYAENHLRGAICTQTHDFTIDYGWPLVCRDGYYRQQIDLPLHPVQSVSSITYVDENGATQTLSSALYTLHKDRPVPFIAKNYDATWPSVRLVPAAVTVRFVAGYDPAVVPDEIRTAILMHVQSLYDCDEKVACETCRDSLLDPYRVLDVA